MRTPTCHSISYSIPFHLTALLPLYINQHTDLANSISTTTGNHSLTPSFSVYFQTKKTAPGKRNYTQQATPTSSANQLMAEQPGQKATCTKGVSSSSERSNCQQHTEKEAWQDRRHDCMATMPCGPGTPPLIRGIQQHRHHRPRTPTTLFTI